MTATGAPRRPSGPLGTRGRAVRLVAALAGLALLTTGTLVGQDAAFPFGPFRFGAVARRYPHGADVTAVRLVSREFPLHDGRSGPARDAVIATWYPR